MEAAALEAYRKDVENNADFTSVAINKKLKDENLTISGCSSSKKLWQEMKSSEGSSYYWNTLTNETVYEPPEEGYISITEQEEQKQDDYKNQLKILQKFHQKDALLQKQEKKKEEAEERARLAREKMKERRVASPEPVVTYGPILDPGPTNPYGKWEVVKTSEQHIDFQLPQQAEYFQPPVEYEPEPPVKEFKEKTVESLGESGKVAFKKRRFGANMKKNARQRLDTD